MESYQLSEDTSTSKNIKFEYTINPYSEATDVLLQCSDRQVQNTRGRTRDSFTYRGECFMLSFYTN